MCLCVFEKNMSVKETSKYSIFYGRSMYHYFLILFLGILSICNVGDVVTQFYNFRGIGPYGGVGRLPRPAIKECPSVDVRNLCQNFAYLDGCTVIKGTLKVVLMPKGFHPVACNYSRYRFPLLREVTDYVIFYDVHGLTNIREMFPSLTVIRGRRLFLNYALGISSMPDLNLVEFRSLVAIQRGHVFIGGCDKLCSLSQTNYDRLTLSTGENHLFRSENKTCNSTEVCRGCPSGYCWSHHVCQQFENDNVMKPILIIKCDPQCLGGCFNTTNRGCAVCKGLTDHGECVAECPSDKFVSEHHYRCYTREECRANKMFVHQKTCVEDCPNGFTKHRESGECIKCSYDKNCDNICNPSPIYGLITIYSLSDAELYKGCVVINCTLIFAIRSKINDKELYEAFADLREIRGHLKIYRSQHLTSLGFLKNLRTIFGSPLETNLYSLIVYENRNLLELWPPHQQLRLMNGSMYIHRNEKLCNQVLQKFRAQVVHDASKDSVQISDQEVLCSPAKLDLVYNVTSHCEFVLFWPMAQTVERVEVLYRYLPPKINYVPETELDTHICRRNEWIRRLLFADEIFNNGTHYQYTVKDLRTSHEYEVLVKTFDSTGLRDARSEVKILKLQLDHPPQPSLSILAVTNTSITIKLSNNEELCPDCVDYYAVEVYELLDDVDMLDTRNFCDAPIADYFAEFETGNLAENSVEYEDCCARQAEQAEENKFLADLQNDYICNRDKTEQCLTPYDSNEDPQLVRRVRLDPKLGNYTLQNLQHFRIYSIQVKACNSMGCSMYAIENERTKYSLEADGIDTVFACKVDASSTPVEYHAYFAEPNVANGAIVAYVLHYREYIKEVKRHVNELICVTRLQHEQNNNRTVSYLDNNKFNQLSIHIFSLSGDVKTKWINITNCKDYDNIYEEIMKNLQNKENIALLKPVRGVQQAAVFVPIIWCIAVISILVIAVGVYKQRYRIRVWYRRLRLRDDFQDGILLHERRPGDHEILVDQNRVHYRYQDLLEDGLEDQVFL